MRAPYPFDDAWRGASQRLAQIEALFDPGTVRHLEACGVGEGSYCLEVGGGLGSIAEWLCQRVGETGHVLVTDLDTRFLDALHYPHLEVSRHDIVSDDLPERAFDLVHERLVLEHLPEREKALQRMVTSLKPGGWVVCEDLDNVSETLVSSPDAASTQLYMKVRDAYDRVLTARGHVYCGRHLYGLLRGQGLVDVQAEGRVFVRHVDSLGGRWTRLSVEQLRGEIVRAGFATDADIEEYLALLDNPAFVAVSHMLMTARGRRPLA